MPSFSEVGVTSENITLLISDLLVMLLLKNSGLREFREKSDSNSKLPNSVCKLPTNPK